jgi:hypothetical protein
MFDIVAYSIQLDANVSLGWIAQRCRETVRVALRDSGLLLRSFYVPSPRKWILFTSRKSHRVIIG